MIALVTGPPGNGKSYYAIRRCAKALIDGKVVAGNVELREDWIEYAAKPWRQPVLRLKPGALRRWRRADERFHYTDDLQELFSLRLAGSGESRGLMVLDEAHNWMNARAWSSGDRDSIVRFFSQHRKLGWDVLLIAQQAEMLDKQVRTLFEYHIQVRNLKRARFMGVPLSPVNLFLAIHTWHAATRVVVKREAFPLSWPKNLYDSMDTFAGLNGAEGGGIVLPSPPAERRTQARTDGRGASASRPPARARARRAPDAESSTIAAALEDGIDPGDLDPSTTTPDG